MKLDRGASWSPKKGAERGNEVRGNFIIRHAMRGLQWNQARLAISAPHRARGREEELTEKEADSEGNALCQRKMGDPQGTACIEVYWRKGDCLQSWVRTLKGKGINQTKRLEGIEETQE